MPEKGDLYRLIIETANEGVWIKDADHTTSFVNDKMAVMLGYTIDEMIGKSFLDFIYDEDLPRVVGYHKAREKGFSEGYDIRLKSKSGATVWTHINVSPLVDKGKFIGSLGMISDITDYKEKELLRKQNERRYRSLFENSPVPTWEENFSEVKKYIDRLKAEGITDIRSYFETNTHALVECSSLMTVNEINAAVVELNEAPDKAYVLENFRSLVNSKSAGYAITQFEAIANGDKSCEFDAELNTFKNNTRHVHLKWTVVAGYEDTYEKVYLTTTDVTDRILAENQRLKVSNLQKELLLKEIHHRVKNNLQIITSLLRLQANSVNDPMVSGLFELSLHRINSMALVHDLLYRSKDFSQIDFNTYLHKLSELLIESLKPPGCMIQLEIETSDIQLNISTSILLGLLVNEIITNSIKHGFTNQESGGIYISVKEEKDHSYLLEVGDDGKGFELTSDIDSIDSLGLPLIFSLVEQLNGTLNKVEKAPGTHYRIVFSELL